MNDRVFLDYFVIDFDVSERVVVRLFASHLKR